MAAAQKKLAQQVTILRGKLEKLLICVDEIFDEGDAIDWRESRKG
jgi:hypothetical protein